MSEGAPGTQDAQIAQLASLTGLDAPQAERYLNAANGDLTLAASLFFDAAAGQAPDDDDAADDAAMASEEQPQDATPALPEAPAGRGGGRTLGGAYVPAAASTPSQTSASRRSAPQRGLRTLKDLQSGGGGSGSGGSGPAAHSGSSDDGDSQGDSQDFFAGGEKSGLAVQNPHAATPQDHINNILRRARQNAPRPGGDDDTPSTSHFRGTGTTLGGDDAPSRTVPDPAAGRPAPPPRVRRELHMWRNGFSVDDGELFRYDDPANSRTLEMINTGHAPLHLLNVEHGQEVDVEVHAHKDEDYKPPKKKYVPFSGSGTRLGSPTAAPSAAAASTTTAASPPTTSTQPTVHVDSSLPTLTLQIRLGDGTRLQSRFNTTHTLGDVYDFVTRSSAESQGRDYALMTTFPSKELTDKAVVLGDMSELKRGGVVVQKWK